MVKVIVFCCLVAATLAAPQAPQIARPGGFPGVGPFNGPTIPGVLGPVGPIGPIGKKVLPNNFNRPITPNQPYNGYEGRNYDGPYEQVRILEQTNEVNPDGSYQYSYATADGQEAHAEGVLKDLGDPEGPSLVARGSYSYTAPDGTPISVEWIADELGFRVQGSHIHESIQKALAVSPVGPGDKIAPFARGPAPAPFARGLAPAPFAGGPVSAPFARGLAPAPFARGLAPAPFARGPAPAPFGSFFNGAPNRGPIVDDVDDVNDDN